MNRLLTAKSYGRIDAELDRFNVFAKPFRQWIDDEIVTVGMRIGERPNHVVAFLGDRVIIRRSGTYAVLPAEEMTAPRFNYLHGVGTRVVAYPGFRPEDCPSSLTCTRLETVTRTPAWTLGHGAAVVSVEGYAGGIALTHIDVVGGAL